MKRTKQEMYSLVAEYHSSGMPMPDFCKQHNLKRSTFYAWVKKVRDESGKQTNKTSTPKKAKKFIAIEKPASGSAVPIATPASVELTYPNGVTLKTSTCDITFLHQLITINSHV